MENVNVYHVQNVHLIPGVTLIVKFVMENVTPQTLFLKKNCTEKCPQGKFKQIDFNGKIDCVKECL